MPEWSASDNSGNSDRSAGIVEDIESIDVRLFRELSAFDIESRDWAFPADLNPRLVVVWCKKLDMNFMGKLPFQAFGA